MNGKQDPRQHFLGSESDYQEQIIDLSGKYLFFIILWNQNCLTINIFSVLFLFFFNFLKTEPLRVSCLHYAPKLTNTLVCNSCKQRSFLPNHNTNIKNGELTLMHYCRLIHTFHRCPEMLLIVKGSSAAYAVCCCYVSLVSFKL